MVVHRTTPTKLEVDPTLIERVETQWAVCIEGTVHTFRESLLEAFMVLHLVVYTKIDRSSSVKNNKRELERVKVQILDTSSVLHT